MSSQLENKLGQYRSAATGQLANPGNGRQWASYAAATGSVLAMAGAADAAIIYSGVLNTGVNFTDGNNATVNLDGGSIDATFNFFTAGFTHKATVIGFGFAGTYGSQALKLSSGALIDAALNFKSQANLISVTSYLSNFGPWAISDTAFLGLFTDQNNFGWIRIHFGDTDSDGLPDDMTIIDYAYEDSGGGIRAGDTGTASIPSPAPLALLAAGAVGIGAMRRRRSPKA